MILRERNPPNKYIMMYPSGTATSDMPIVRLAVIWRIREPRSMFVGKTAGVSKSVRTVVDPTKNSTYVSMRQKKKLRLL